MAQQGRKLAWTLEEEGIKLTAVIHDGNVLGSVGARVILTPLMAPRAKTYATDCTSFIGLSATSLRAPLAVAC